MSTVLWTEKYRPNCLDDMVLSDDNRSLFQSFIDAEEIPHLLLLGPAGCGKTTVAKILIRNLDAQVLLLNASSERGIDTIRSKVATFAKARSMKTWNIVFLDEADATTSDAQTALRNIIETFSKRTRFILTGNYGHKIIDPLQSRCQVIKMGETPVKERYRLLKNVLEEEGRAVDDPALILSYADTYTDMRKMLFAAQRSILSKGTLVPAKSLDISGYDIYLACTKGKWNKVIEATRDPAFDCRSLLVDMFWTVPDDFSHAASWRFIIAKAVHESGFTPDAHVLFAGTCAELITDLE